MRKKLNFSKGLRRQWQLSHFLIHPEVIPLQDLLSHDEDEYAWAWGGVMLLLFSSLLSHSNFYATKVSICHSLAHVCYRQGLLARVLFAVNPVTISEQSECRVSCYFHSDFTGVALLHYFLCNTIGYILITFSTSSSSMEQRVLLLVERVRIEQQTRHHRM